MERMEYKIDISAPARTVWDTMLQKATYEQWAGKAWPGSTYEGKWAKGEKIRFTGSDGNGTLAEITELKPYVNVLARHVAVLLNGKEDRTSDQAKGWIGTTERYQFNEHNGHTTITVTIETNPEWRKMFDDSWPGALEELKRITEHQMASV